MLTSVGAGGRIGAAARASGGGGVVGQLGRSRPLSAVLVGGGAGCGLVGPTERIHQLNAWCKAPAQRHCGRDGRGRRWLITIPTLPTRRGPHHGESSRSLLLRSSPLGLSSMS